MAIGGAFLGGGVEVVPAGSCKLELEILTEDRANLSATFTIKGTTTYTVTAGSDGRAVYTVPSGQTYTVSVSTTGYDNLSPQTVVAESGTVRYVRFEAFAGRVKRSGDTMTGELWVERNYAGMGLNRGTSGNSNFMFNATINGTNTTVARVRNITDETKNRIQIHLTKPDGSSLMELVSIVNEGSFFYATAPTVSDKVDNSTKIATTAWVNQTDFLVHSYGNEEIAGVKTFTSNPRIVNTAPIVDQRISGFTRGTLPSNNNAAGVRIGDAAGTIVGGVRGGCKTNGDGRIYMEIYNYNGSKSTSIDLYAPLNSDSYATAPTTPSDATSNEIATANWSIGKFVQKSGDTMTGTLKFDKRGIQIDYDTTDGTPIQINNTKNGNMSIGFSTNGLRTSLIRSNESDTNKVISLFVFGSEGAFSNYGALTCNYIKSTNEFYANAPSFRIGTNDNSNKVLTIAMANKLPSLVHTSDDETVGGTKTFTSPPIMNIPISAGSGGSGIFRQISFADNNGAFRGGIRTEVGNIQTVVSLRAYNMSGMNPKSIEVVCPSTGDGYALAPTTPTNANSNEIATAKWVNTKVGAKNKVTNVTSYTQLMDLIKNGKRGDSFGITMDYVGGSIGGIYATDREVHAFGHYTIDEITVSGGALTGLQAFGSGEVSGKLKNDDDTTYTYATSGFGRQAIGNSAFDGFRVAEDGKLTYFALAESTISAFEGYYISI